MTEPVTVTIGGEPIVLPPVLNFSALERIWPAMKALDASSDVVERAAARLAIISGALKETQPELTVPELKRRLRVDGFNEITGLIDPVHKLLVASGLVNETEIVPGNGATPVIPADATATSTSSTSSPN